MGFGNLVFGEMGATDGAEEVPPGAGREEKIFVSVRLRPLNGREIARNDVSDWECISDSTIVYKNANLSMPERSMYPSAYTFDRVFSSDCSTREVYKEGAKEVALSVVSGINSSIFAYGQTSSGKTFTMTGITEFTLADIYDYIQKHTERQFLLKFSAMEIYNESVRDLLSVDNTPLRLLDDPERGTIVEKLMEETVRDWNHVMELLSICEAQRQIGETTLNETSSRSHQIVRLTIESSAREFLRMDNSSTLVAAVNFVDLAGSERASQSLTEGTRLKEGCHINRSLLTLGTVIRKLSKGRSGHVPFRDSKLTRILQSSLGGNGRTAIICTMSPARSHVEQSRNTLLFASCAKEVSTSAQVNMVMSDKALVKHLQRELVRLESELRTPGSTIMPSNFTALLREKDLQIEKLEKEVNDLTLERDAAQSQVQHLLNLVRDDGSSLIRLGSDNYPHLRVQRSPESESLMIETSIVAGHRSLHDGFRTFGSARYSGQHSESNSEEQYIEIPDFEGTFPQNSTAPRLMISNSQMSDSDSCQGWEDVEEQSNATSDDLCKEVRCIETEKTSTNNYAESNCFYPDEKIGIATLMFEHVDRENQDSQSPVLKGGAELVSLTSKESGEFLSPELNRDREVVTSSLKEDREVVTSSLKEDREVVQSALEGDLEVASKPSNEDMELYYIHPSTTTSEKQSQWSDLSKDLCSSKSLKLIKSRSCKASLLISMSSPWFEKVENNENTPPNGSEKDFTGRPQSFSMKVSTLNYGQDLETISRKGSQSSVGMVAQINHGTEEKYSTDEGTITINKGVAGMNEIGEPQQDKQVDDSPEKETEAMAINAVKSVKDVGLDPMEDAYGAPTWPSEFKRLQREIIELWHACNVSLLHRTYFFLLFKGDPTDSIYMEVELRRLSFLNKKFSVRNQIAEDGQTQTPASGIKAIRRERQMLSKQMQKKLSEQERESLYLRWGIGLSSKYRRIQLANRLWTKTDDIDHIADSSVVVAKLVGFIEPGLTPKEMFGINFGTQPHRRSYSFKRSLLPLL